MRVKASITSYEDVDVSASQIIKAAVTLFNKKYGSSIKGEYINESGYWMVFDYTHPHNGEDHYRKGPLALPEERQLLDIRNMIESLETE